MKNYKEIEDKFWSAVQVYGGDGRRDSFSLALLLLFLHKENKIIEILNERQKGDMTNIILDKLYHLYPEHQQLFSSIVEELIGLDFVKHDQITDVLQILFSIDVDILNKGFLEIIESLFHSISMEAGKMGGVIVQPNEVTELVQYFMPKKEKLSVFNPFAGLASYATNLPENANYFGQELNRKTWALANLRLIAHGLTDRCQLEQIDSLHEGGLDKNNVKFDFVASTPPFASKIKFHDVDGSPKIATMESFTMESSLHNLKSDGISCVVTSTGFLFRAGKEKDVKKDLLENKHIKMIITLPSKLYSNTGVNTALIVLSKQKVEDGVLLVAGEDCYTKSGRINILDLQELNNIIEVLSHEKKRRVPFSEIAENGYNLMPKRYLTPDVEVKAKHELVKLKNLIKVNTDKVYASDADNGKVIRIGDLNNEKDNYSTSFDAVETSVIPKRYVKIPDNSLLLATFYQHLKPTFFSSSEIDCYCGMNLLMAKVNNDLIRTEYLVQELNKKYVQDQLDKYRIGSSVQSISRTDLLKIKIQVPTFEVQDSEILAFKNNIIQIEQEKLNKLILESNIDTADENSFLRHQIAGRLKNARGAFNSIQSIVNEKLKNDFPQILNYKLKESSAQTLGSFLKILERDLKSIHKSVQRVSQSIDVVDPEMVDVEIISFTKNYCTELMERSRDKNYSIDFSTTVLDDENLIDKCLLKADPDLLRKMFDNIVQNAEQHAFSKGVKEILDVLIMFNLEDETIQIDFSNTGEPFPKDFDFANYVRKGSTAGIKSGDGTGGWFINEVMKIHKGELSITDETGPEGIGLNFASTIELTFPIAEIILENNDGI